jgi:hypothetical protein
MTRVPARWTLLALPVLLAGCASSQAASTSSGHQMAGMSMAPGQTMAAAGSSSEPPESAAMVCGEEIKGKVQQVLALPTAPATESTWAQSVFTCTYHLPMGAMTLSVRVLPGTGQAGAELDAGQARTPGAQPLAGLGERAWGTADGTAVVLKDAQVLTVDATGLPEVFGANGQKRTDLAYEVASDVMGCWTGDGDE